MIWLLLVALVLGILAYLFRYPLQRIAMFWSRSRRLRAAQTLVSQPAARRHYEVSLHDLRDFASSLLLGTSMRATLAQALQKTAEQFRKRGIFGARLNRYVEARVAESPEAVLSGLIQDFRSEYLEDTLRRIEISRRTGGSLVDALTVTVETIEEDISSGISRRIREAANQLTVPMIMGVFFSIVVLGVLPLIWTLLESLGGQGQ